MTSRAPRFSACSTRRRSGGDAGRRPLHRARVELRLLGVARGGLEDARAGLVAALVVANRGREGGVAAGEQLLRLVGGELVVPGGGLGASESGDALERGRALRVGLLVGRDLRERRLRLLGQLGDDLLGGQVVVAGDRSRDGGLRGGRRGVRGGPDGRLGALGGAARGGRRAAGGALGGAAGAAGDLGNGLLGALGR